MLQEALLVGGRGRGHGRREVGQEPGVDGEAAHDFERRRRVLLPHGDAAHVAGLHDAAALDVGQVERPALPAPGGFGGQRLHRLVPDPLGRYVDDLALRPAQRCHLPAEDGPGVQAEGVVHPGRGGHGRVAVDHRGTAAVLLGPRIAHGQAELVGLTGRVPVQRVRTDSPRGAPVVLLGEPRVTDDQLALVQDVVADQSVDELRDLLAELRVLGVLPLQLLHGLGEAVAVLDLAPLEVTAELVLVVAGHTQRVARRDHGHDAAQHPGAVGAAVHEVAHEHGGTAFGVGAPLVPQLGEQGVQFRAAAVDVADDVEGAGEVAEVVVAALQDDFGRVGLLLGAQYVNLAEAFALQPAQRTAQLPAMTPHDMTGHAGAVGPGGVARLTDLFRQVQHDGDGQHVVLPGELDELFAALWLHVGRVDDGEPARGETLARDVVEDVEGVPAGALVVLVVGDEAPAEVRGDDLGRLEVPAGEGGLARSAGADEDDEGQVGHGQCG